MNSPGAAGISERGFAVVAGIIRNSFTPIRHKEYKLLQLVIVRASRPKQSQRWRLLRLFAPRNDGLYLVSYGSNGELVLNVAPSTDVEGLWRSCCSRYAQVRVRLRTLFNSARI
jgi:hypothetical protein